MPKKKEPCRKKKPKPAKQNLKNKIKYKVMSYSYHGYILGSND